MVKSEIKMESIIKEKKKTISHFFLLHWSFRKRERKRRVSCFSNLSIYIFIYLTSFVSSYRNVGMSRLKAFNELRITQKEELRCPLVFVLFGFSFQETKKERMRPLFSVLLPIASVDRGSSHYLTDGGSKKGRRETRWGREVELGRRWFFFPLMYWQSFSLNKFSLLFQLSESEYYKTKGKHAVI